MKKLILAVLIAASALGTVTPSANADVVIVVGHRHRHHRYYHHPAMIWVPGHNEGRWWRRHWVPGHWVPA